MKMKEAMLHLKVFKNLKCKKIKYLLFFLNYQNIYI